MNDVTTEFSLLERNKSGKCDFQQKKTNECEGIHLTSVKALLSLTVHQQISTLAPKCIKKKAFISGRYFYWSVKLNKSKFLSSEKPI